MRALNRRVQALEVTARPIAANSPELDDARCLLSAERLEKACAEHLARNETGTTAEKLARQKQELKDLVRRLRAAS